MRYLSQYGRRARRSNIATVRQQGMGKWSTSGLSTGRELTVWKLLGVSKYLIQNGCPLANEAGFATRTASVHGNAIFLQVRLWGMTQFK
jgi:hypothetical protein